jgi:hypothetical protein
MGAESAGKKLGIGLRLAARAARQRAGAVVAPTSSQGRSIQEVVPEPYKYQGTLAQAVSLAAQATAKGPTFPKGLGRGAKRFAEAVWGPMAYTGSVLSLEITAGSSSDFLRCTSAKASTKCGITTSAVQNTGISFSTLASR